MSQLKLIETFSDFMKLGTAWDELLCHSEADHAFMKHRWFDQWIRAFEAQDSLAIVTAWRDGQLAGALPLHRRDFNFRGVRARGLSFLSSDFTPRCNFICVDNDLVMDLGDAAFSLQDWDIIYMGNLEEETAATNKFVKFLGGKGQRFDSQIVEGLHSPYLLTDGSWDDYWSTLPTKTKRHLERMCMRRLDKVEYYELVKIETPQQFEDFKQAMFDISAKSWKADSGDHLIADTPQGRFYSEYTPVALESGDVCLYVLKIEGTAVGFEYHLSCNDRHSMIRCDFDREYKYYTPGNGLRVLILKRMFAQKKACEYDMGGDAYSYKLKWTSNIRKHISITIGNSTPRGVIIMTAKNKILPKLRSYRRLVPFN
ncbi:MAG: GNAT family N-acetyltransferase [Candidatus Zixiibacteriota bacterium]